MTDDHLVKSLNDAQPEAVGRLWRWLRARPSDRRVRFLMSHAARVASGA